MTAQWPPTYTIRRSNRARRLQLQFHPVKGLEIVIPRRTRHVDVELLINSHQSWIKSRLQHATTAAPVLLPDSITLSMLSETWQIQYFSQSTLYDEVTIKEMPGSLHLSIHHHGEAIDYRQIILHKLREWCMQKSSEYLLPWIKQLSKETGLTYNRVTIKSMSSCWGSCTALKNISLNYQLIFLPPHCARYILLHELCHIQHLNHSQQFWQLLKKWDVNAILHRKQCRQAQATLPNWISFS